jgi:cysteinyl-tRNA synthetase
MPEIQLFNTMSRAVEPLRPLAPPTVSLYVCGPTIYNYGHIGNFRTYVAVDLLRRALRHFGYEVDHVMQFTDVDDKTIRGARVNQDEYEKEGVGDFVLWKKWTPADGDVGWDSPWGKGRPGWHIECSALSLEFLAPESFSNPVGDPERPLIDIHGGGTDLRFPHHENEIAQSEKAVGRKFVGTWFHVEHLLVDGQKMSKSLGNMYTVREVLERGYTGRELRYALLSGAHYSKNLNFTWQGMDDAKTALARIDEWRKRLTKYCESATESDRENAIVKGGVEAAHILDKNLADNLNINEVLGQIFQAIRTTNGALDSQTLMLKSALGFIRAWTIVDSVLGLGEPISAIPTDVQALADQRAAARQAKDFSQSDTLRKQIESLGWKVKDTPKGQELSPL